MSKELWSTVTLRNQIMNIAETIAPLYKTRRHDEYNNYPRFISVKNVEFIREKIGETLEFDVEIEFLSDIGFWTEPVIIRFFTSHHYFEEEIQKYYKFEGQFSSLTNIRPNELIFTDENDLFVVYEGPKGKLIDTYVKDQDLISFQLGVIAAYLHSAERYKIDCQQIKSISDYLLYHLPFPKKDKTTLTDLVNKQIEKMRDCYAGYQPIAIYDKRLFYFIPSELEVSKHSISLNKAFDIEIIFHQPQDTVYDRMGDIASIYAEQALEEFIVMQNVNQTTEDIINFLEGYESVFEKSQVSFMDFLYPNGLTLDLHMLLGIWLIYYYQITGDMDLENKFDLDEIINFSYYLLTFRPFNLFQNREEIQN